MSVVVDTSILVDALRASEPALDYLGSLPQRPSASEVTRVEVLPGVRSGERRRTEQLLFTVEWVPVDEAVARQAGRLGREYRRSHPGVAVADLVIAGTAVRADLPLATRNVRHFPMFEGLRAPY